VSGYGAGLSESGRSGSSNAGCSVSTMHHEAGDPRVFPPIVATHLVKLACELPEDEARSLSTWTCSELARTMVRDGVVESMSASSVQRILAAEKLKPWRVHHWLSSKVPRDDHFRQTVVNISDLYTRKLDAHERVLSLDEKTSLQPRTRTSRNRPARPGNEPVVVEHEYVRKGALNLFAAFDTRTGKVLGILRKRKRQVEFIELLEAIDRTTPPWVTIIHLLCDNLSIHAGQLARAWLAAHPRFRMHFTPVHCSWMNQVEQWFSILQRKRLRAPNFADLSDLEVKILAFIDEWNDIAHPFHWTPKSFEKVLRSVDDPWRRHPHWSDVIKAPTFKAAA
jgi:transposase